MVVMDIYEYLVIDIDRILRFSPRDVHPARANLGVAPPCRRRPEDHRLRAVPRPRHLHLRPSLAGPP